MRTSAVVGTVALGIGLGSPLAGWLSGRKVELGLVPLGALGMVAGCLLAAFTLDFIPGLVVFIILIGFSTGFYLVPLFTLLQHRSPKTSKGDMIATSNFINVTGAIGASALFFVLVFVARRVDFVERVPLQDGYAQGELKRLDFEHGRPIYFEVEQANGTVAGGRPLDPNAPPPNPMEHIFGRNTSVDGTPAAVVRVKRGIEPGSQVVVSTFELRGVRHFKMRRQGEVPNPSYDARHLPRFLFIGAGLMTLATLLTLWRRMPDLLKRSVWVTKSLFGPPVILGGIHNLPGDGPTVLATTNGDPALHAVIRSATDRSTRFFDGEPNRVETAVASLRAGNMIAVVLDGMKGDEFLRALAGRLPIEIVPVFAKKEHGALMVRFGTKLAAATSMDELRNKIAEARFAEEQ